MDIFAAASSGLFVFFLVSSIKYMHKKNALFYTLLALASFFASVTVSEVLPYFLSNNGFTSIIFGIVRQPLLFRYSFRL